MTTTDTTLATTRHADDLLTHEQAQAAISNNPYLARQQVQVEFHDGQVTLRGRVGSFFQKQMAQESLRQLRGVAINNQLQVL